LLLLPTGRGPLIRSIVDALGQATQARPVVLTTFEPTAAYHAALHAACPAALVLRSERALEEHVATLDPSEQLLLLDAAFYPHGGFTPDLFARVTAGNAGEQGVAQHLLVVDVAPEGTKEFVQEDGDGRVRRIQRYYYPVTWPFASGVACSVVPISAFLPMADPPLASLVDLRRALGASGSPSRDVPLARGAIDLRGEDGLLSLVEQLAKGAGRRATPRAGSAAVARGAAPPAPLGGSRSRVAKTARLVGPVLLEDDVQVDEGAVVIGPSLLCAGTRVGARAVVAQCLLMPGTEVPAGEARRQRVVFSGAAETAGAPAARVHASRSASIVVSAPTARAAVYPEVKAVVERVIAVLALTALMPLCALIALAVKLTSPGPVFFGHLREGRNGRPFRCWKFRTMRVGADAAQRELMAQQELDGPQFKMARDPRVTSAGRVLRMTNLDELPQLFNVALGQMSFVGPRPSPFRENQICVPWRQGRLSVRPGITGLWQVCRHDRDQGDFHQWIEYDLLYVQHMSWRTDLRILAATIRTLGGKRACAVSEVIPEAADARRARPGRAGRVVPAGRVVRRSARGRPACGARSAG
jgi:lipopolysaccharide/colanic/teichoic acid biosynthesis glycosyltransferase